MMGTLRQKTGGLCKDERGFTLGEVLITIVIMGIVFGIASSTWQGTVESRQVDSATNQLASDLRLAHTNASNRLAPYTVTFTGATSYTIGPSLGGTSQTRTLSDRARLTTTITSIQFSADGKAMVNPSGIAADSAADKVQIGTTGRPALHEVKVNRSTSRVKVD